MGGVGIMKWTPATDGIDHINVYSNGKTELGRLLSNFAATPFVVDNFGRFASVEAFWYYILTGDENLRTLHGFTAKTEGKVRLPEDTEDQIPQEFLKMAYEAKLEHNPKIKEMLLNNSLPLAHYYVFKNGHIHSPVQYQWTVELWEEIKRDIT